MGKRRCEIRLHCPPAPARLSESFCPEFAVQINDQGVGCLLNSLAFWNKVFILSIMVLLPLLQGFGLSPRKCSVNHPCSDIDCHSPQSAALAPAKLRPWRKGFAGRLP